MLKYFALGAGLNISNAFICFDKGNWVEAVLLAGLAFALWRIVLQIEKAQS